MIYEFPPADKPIRQGDVFSGIPRVDISLGTIAIVDELELREEEWTSFADGPDPVTVAMQLVPVTAIVATQDCDNVRSTDITLCEIRSFPDVEGKARDAKKPKAWVSIITQHARQNLKWFYLPPDSQAGFNDKMAVDFGMALRVPRLGLEAMRSRRCASLNPVAREHFRERLAEFFRRYPYDEWYPLDAEELDHYRKSYPDATPYPWQTSPGPSAPS